MRSLISKQHPLSGQKALANVLQALSSAPPEDALAEAASLIESSLGNPDMGETERLRLLFALDEATQPHVRGYIDHYLAALREASPSKNLLWSAARSHWALIFDAYGECLNAAATDKSLHVDAALAELAIRTIRSGTLRAKWDAFRHGPIENSVWSRLNLAYRLAVRCGVQHLPLQLRPGRATETTAEREYLRAIAQHGVGPDQLDAERFELAARLIHYVLHYLELTPTPNAASLHWLDCALSLPPARIVNLPANATMPRFFSGMAAVHTLEELLDLVVAGEMPTALSVSGENAHARVASVLSHIIRGWSNQPPQRRHRRHAMPGQLLVIDGLTRFVARLSGDASDSALHTWTVRDASLQGIGAEAPLDDTENLNVGTLVGMHSVDGDRWRIGAVRRMWRMSDKTGQVGIELLGGAPVAASADDGANAVRVIVLEPLKRGQPVRLAVPSPGPRQGEPLYLLDHGKAVKLTPVTTLEYGTDFEIRAYLVAP
ncbi:MAG TPA: hypothetical protein VFW00_01255 [Rhodocyclaceae bacterium]|nr:hypothetical protein [Rhodocyclaceae bacterium]